MVDAKLRQNIRRKLGYADALIRGRLATDSTGPYAPRAGYMRVEVQKGPNEFLPAVEALNETQANDPGVFVLMKEEENELVIVKVDARQELARGSNPTYSGGPNQDAFGYIQTNALVEFRTIPVSPVTTEVYVSPGFMSDGRYFAGARTTTLTAALAALSTDYHQLALTYVNPQRYVGVVFSTEQHIQDGFDTTDLLECMRQVPPRAVASKAIELVEGATSLSDSDFKYDLRAPVVEYKRIITTTTSDASATVPSGATVGVTEDQIVHIKAIVTAYVSDMSAGLTAVVQGGYRRATGGNVTLIGSLDSVLNEDSTSSPTVTLYANTTNQTVGVQITGVASETWNWTIRIETDYNLA